MSAVFDQDAYNAAAAEIIATLENAVQTKADADAAITEALTQARRLTPPVPLSVLARATGLSESGVSVRVARAVRERD